MTCYFEGEIEVKDKPVCIAEAEIYKPRVYFL
jgi:hypothetical protein